MSTLTQLTSGHFKFEADNGYKAIGHRIAVREAMIRHGLDFDEVDYAFDDLDYQCNNVAQFGINGYFIYSRLETSGPYVLN